MESNHDYPPGDPALLAESGLQPMGAVAALYSGEDAALSRSIVASLSTQIFDRPPPAPATRFRRGLALFMYRLVKRTTREVPAPDGSGAHVYRNRLLERSGHAYADVLLNPSGSSTETFVEGGDPMNGPYMMISPEIRANADRWDRILLDSMLARDVQLRFTLETLATYRAAVDVLASGRPVRLKAEAAGTGLSLVLVYDRLLRDGHPPGKITATVTDREASNLAKTERLLADLPTAAAHLADDDSSPGINVRTEDVHSPEGAGSYDVITLVGILEYFRGHTCSIMEDFRGLEPAGGEHEADEIVASIAAKLAPGGKLIVNNYRPLIGARIIESFGKRLRYRHLDDLHALMATSDLQPAETIGSGHVYDVVSYA